MRRPIIIAAAARMGRVFHRNLRTIGVTPVCFIDNDSAKHDTMIDGIPVLSPSRALAMWPHATVFVASLIAEYELREQLRSLGFKDVLTLSQLHHRDPEIFHAPYLDGAWESWRGAPTIEWSDDESRLVYAGILEYRRTRDVGVMAALRSAHLQYFPPGLVTIDSSDTVVDCGAFDGDTFRAMRVLFPERAPTYYAFEPDPVNYAQLSESAHGYPGVFVAINAGVGEQSGTLSFTSNARMDSGFRPDGDLTIPIQTLDAFFARRDAPTFLKADIEGMEPQMLRGARHTIAHHMPTLAICVYHEPRHLWEIPQFVRTLMPRCSLYLRHYSTNLSETVMYATP